MKNKHLTKPLGFIVLSVSSIASFFASLGGDLQPYAVYSRKNQGLGLLGGHAITIYHGHDEKPPQTPPSKLVAARHDDDLVQKSILLCVALLGAATSLLLSTIDFSELELQSTTNEIEQQARKQLKLEQVKNRYALMTIAQREQFRLELASLIELTGGDDTLQADEINATDRFINCSYLVAEGHSLDQAIAQTWQVQIGSPDHQTKKQEFQDWSSGKA